MSREDPGYTDPDAVEELPDGRRPSDMGRDLTQLAIIALIVGLAMLVEQPVIAGVAVALLVVFGVSVVWASLARDAS